jgi:phenylacetate-CoA ligase
MNQKLAKKLYLLGAKLRDEKIAEYLEELEKTQWLSADELRKRQWDKLKILIDYAYKNAPFYKDRWDKSGIQPDRVNSFEDFSKLPILTKEEFRQNIDDIFVQNRGVKFSLVKTSGSTGMPLKFYKDRVASGYTRAAMYRGHRWYGVDIGEKEAKLWGIPVNFFPRLKVKLEDFALNRFRESEYNLKYKVLYNFYKKMLKEKPRYLFGYASMVYQFALFLSEQHLDGRCLKITMVKVTGEMLYEYQRRLIEKVFECKLANEYGASETGLIAFQCPEGGMHIMADCIYLEVINKDTNGLGELLVTDLNNFSLPLIRYKLGDSGSFLYKSCICGRQLPLLNKIGGRRTDIVISTSGHRLHSVIFYYIMKGLFDNGGGVKQFKAYQKTQNKILLQVVKDKNFTDKTISYLNNRIREHLGKDMIIDYNFVDLIPREPSGKLRDFVQETPSFITKDD